MYIILSLKLGDQPKRVEYLMKFREKTINAKHMMRNKIVSISVQTRSPAPKAILKRLLHRMRSEAKESF